MKTQNEPQLSAEIDRKLDDEISYLLHEMVDGDWCPALGIPHYNPLSSTSTTKSKPNYKVVNLVDKCECGGEEKITKFKHFLATALEEQKADFLRKVEELRKPEKDHLLDYDDIPTCYACDFDQAIDEVVSILNGNDSK